MTRNTKLNILLFLFSSVVALALLSGSLSNLQLHSGGPFPGGGNSNRASQLSAGFPPVETYFSPILKGIFAVIFLILTIQIPVRLIALLNIERTFQFLLIVITLLMIASLISYLPGVQPVHLPGESFEMRLPSVDYPVSPLGEPPQGLIRLVLICFGLGAVLLSIQVLRQRQSPARVEDQLSKDAEFAVNAIGAGESLPNVILRCYMQMSYTLQEERGIERSNTMTVREFEDSLALKGFPAVPVRDLSRLFEKVRYGRQDMSAADEKTAVESLNEIIQYCRSNRD